MAPIGGCKEIPLSHRVGSSCELRAFFEILEQFNLFQTVRASGFDGRLSDMTYFRAREVDWSRNSISMQIYQYLWETVEVLRFFKCRLNTRKINYHAKVTYSEETIPGINFVYVP